MPLNNHNVIPIRGLRSHDIITIKDKAISQYVDLVKLLPLELEQLIVAYTLYDLHPSSTPIDAPLGAKFFKWSELFNFIQFTTSKPIVQLTFYCSINFEVLVRLTNKIQLKLIINMKEALRDFRISKCLGDYHIRRISVLDSCFSRSTKAIIIFGCEKEPVLLFLGKLMMYNPEIEDFVLVECKGTFLLLNKFIRENITTVDTQLKFCKILVKYGPLFTHKLKRIKVTVSNFEPEDIEDFKKLLSFTEKLQLKYEDQKSITKELLKFFQTNSDVIELNPFDTLTLDNWSKEIIDLNLYIPSLNICSTSGTAVCELFPLIDNTSKIELDSFEFVDCTFDNRKITSLALYTSLVKHCDFSKMKKLNSLTISGPHPKVTNRNEYQNDEDDDANEEEEEGGDRNFDVEDVYLDGCKIDRESLRTIGNQVTDLTIKALLTSTVTGLSQTSSLPIYIQSFKCISSELALYNILNCTHMTALFLTATIALENDREFWKLIPRRLSCLKFAFPTCEELTLIKERIIKNTLKCFGMNITYDKFQDTMIELLLMKLVRIICINMDYNEDITSSAEPIYISCSEKPALVMPWIRLNIELDTKMKLFVVAGSHPVIMCPSGVSKNIEVVETKTGEPFIPQFTQFCNQEKIERVTLFSTTPANSEFWPVGIQISKIA